MSDEPVSAEVWKFPAVEFTFAPDPERQLLMVADDPDCRASYGELDPADAPRRGPKPQSLNEREF